MNKELKILLGLVAAFLGLYCLPVDLPRDATGGMPSAELTSSGKSCTLP